MTKLFSNGELEYARKLGVAEALQSKKTISVEDLEKVQTFQRECSDKIVNRILLPIIRAKILMDAKQCPTQTGFEVWENISIFNCEGDCVITSQNTDLTTTVKSILTTNIDHFDIINTQFPHTLEHLIESVDRDVTCRVNVNKVYDDGEDYEYEVYISVFVILK